MELRFSAIVVKKTDVGEGDRLLVLYTREAGKVRAMARGVRKPNARLSAQLENFHRSQIIVMRSRGTGNIKSAYIEVSRNGLRGDFAAMAEAFAIADFFDRNIGWEEPDAELFDALEAYLEALMSLVQTNRMERALLLRALFLFQIMTHLGHGLEISRCVVSGSVLSPGDHFVSVSRGGLVDDEMVRNGDVRDARRISMENIKLMRLAVAHPLRALLNVVVDNRHVRSFLSFLREYEECSFR